MTPRGLSSRQGQRRRGRHPQGLNVRAAPPSARRAPSTGRRPASVERGGRWWAQNVTLRPSEKLDARRRPQLERQVWPALMISPRRRSTAGTSKPVPVDEAPNRRMMRCWRRSARSSSGSALRPCSARWGRPRTGDRRSPGCPGRRWWRRPRRSRTGRGGRRWPRGARCPDPTGTRRPASRGLGAVGVGSRRRSSGEPRPGPTLAVIEDCAHVLAGGEEVEGLQRRGPGVETPIPDGLHQQLAVVVEGGHVVVEVDLRPQLDPLVTTMGIVGSCDGQVQSM